VDLQSIDPRTGTVLRRFPETPPAEVAEVVARCHAEFLRWRERSIVERAAPMRRAARLVRELRDELSTVIVEEMGKPITEARAEIDKCAWVCEYYADHAERFLAREVIATDASASFVAFRPLGVVLAVMPWNFPFWQVFRFAAPALMAGNGALLKHASNVPACALAIESLFREAGFPDDLFRSVLIGSARIDELLAHPAVVAATLTGSTPAGRAIASRAGELLKKTVLELGGSDPYVVLEDADLDVAVPACVVGRMINGGQSCIAAKRFLVSAAVAPEFERRVVEAMAAKRMGDPMDDATELGPMARRDLRDELHDQVARSARLGARLVLGGEVPAGEGAYYPPTVLADVRPGMPAFDEETFGPVAAIVPCRDDDDAVRLANATPFGLGAAVFTRESARGEAIAEHRLDAGCCFVNAFVRSDPRLPFGGVKESGYGRELGPFGIREFVNVKTVWVR